MRGAVLPYLTTLRRQAFGFARPVHFALELFFHLKNFVPREGQPRRGDAMNRNNEYRAKAFELLSLAEAVNDPERRADMLRYARMWMNL